MTRPGRFARPRRAFGFDANLTSDRPGQLTPAVKREYDDPTEGISSVSSQVCELENIAKLSEDEMDAPVEIVVTSRNVDVSDHFRSHITQKLAHLERYDSNLFRCDVELDHENNPRQSKASQRVAILGHGKGGTVRAEAHGPDFHAALDAAVAKLDAQLRRNHDRGREHHDRHQQAAVAPTQTMPPAQA
jgi:ribosomal subunit interface protein